MSQQDKVRWLDISYYGLTLFRGNGTLFISGDTAHPANKYILEVLGFKDTGSKVGTDQGNTWAMQYHSAPEARQDLVQRLMIAFPEGRRVLRDRAKVNPWFGQHLAQQQLQEEQAQLQAQNEKG